MTDAVYYRYDDYLEGSGGYDVHGEYVPGPSMLRVHVLTYPVEKKTPKGAWVRINGERQFIADRWFKKYANPTQEGARLDFIARKQRLIDIQTVRIRDAQEAIDIAVRNEPALAVFRCG